MTTLTIEIPDKVGKTITDLIEQLGGKVIMSDSKSGKKLSKSETKFSQKEKAFLKGLDESIEFVNLHKQGKVKARSIDQLLNEL
jgi:ABC-type oligopeptide transport system ATPase subunit